MFYKGSAVSSNGGGSITVDQTYDATSPNAQSGTAVAEAVATKQNVLTAGSNITISNGTISATDTTYSAFGGATSSVAGSAGLVPAPTTGDVDKYLKGDGTWSAISGLQNMATQNSSLSITETITGVGSVNFGTMYNPSSSNRYDSTVSIGVGTYTGGIGDVVIGNSARALGSYSTAIGISAYAKQNYSIQLGYGENNEAKSFYVGFYDTNSSLRNNYKLLDGTTGKIPNDRINVDANPTQNSTNFVTSGTIYSVLGNINTLLAAI